MMIKNKVTLVSLLCILIAWTFLLFSDAYFGDGENSFEENKNIEVITNNVEDLDDNYIDNSNIGQNFHTSASTKDKKDETSTKYLETIENIDDEMDALLLEESLNKTKKGIDKKLDENISTDIGKKSDNTYSFDYDEDFENDELNLNDNNIIKSGTSISDSINVLKQIYEKDNDPEVFSLLISKLIQNYQFTDARNYLSTIDIFKEQPVSIRDYIYVYINTLSTTDSISISKFDSFLNETKERSLISSDDYNFYKGLISLWNGDYSGAISLFNLVTSPTYSNFISQFSGAIKNYSIQQGVPEYYEDALISLVCMKNGYFTLANKLSVHVLLENDKYILPYQILAYSNFLTRNREKSIDYLYELVSLDNENYDKYNFYIGISYYWYGNYEKSIAALVPLLNTSYQSDVYRYLLLDYEKIGNQNKMIQIWQKQLGGSSLKDSDFKYFFDQFFYQPFSNGEDYVIYKEYKQMSYDFVSTCYKMLGGNSDTCIYGSVGLDIANGNWTAVKENLFYLSQNYPQASIYHALGNYYKYIGDNENAKEYFLKAIKLSNNNLQKNTIEEILF